jgi:hypothetical protein
MIYSKAVPIRKISFFLLFHLFFVADPDLLRLDSDPDIWDWIRIREILKIDIFLTFFVLKRVMNT